MVQLSLDLLDPGKVEEAKNDAVTKKLLATRLFCQSKASRDFRGDILS